MLRLQFKLLWRTKMVAPMFILLACGFSLRSATYFPAMLLILLISFVLNGMFLKKNISDNSELYHLLTDNSYDKTLVSKTLAISAHFNIQFIVIYGLAAFVEYVQFNQISSFTNFIKELFNFNTWLFLAMMLGDAVYLSDLSKIKGIWNPVLKYFLFVIYFVIAGLIFQVVLSFFDFMAVDLIVLMVSVGTWYLRSRQYRRIYFKNLIIPDIYDKNH